MARKVILAGGSGFIGSAVARHLAAEGWDVVILTRGSKTVLDRVVGARPVAWDGTGVGAWTSELEGAQAIVNLAGASVNAVPTERNRQKILQSRLAAVRALGEALARTAQRPAAWIQGSAVGYYGPHGDEPCTEDTAPGNDFLAQVCREWEAAFAASCPGDVRPVVLRFGMVLGRTGGAFPLLARLARAGLGGTAGHGRQGISWVHVDDVVQIITRALAPPDLRGAYNVCAPQPLPNADFMRALRAAVHRPWSPPAPAFMVRLGARYLLRTNPDLVLDGQFAVPRRLEAAGYQFRFPALAPALADLVKS